MKFKKYVPYILVVLLAASIAEILWLTLFARLGTDARDFYLPLWSYRAIAHGSGTVLFQNIGNVIMFIPIGVIIALLLQHGVKQGLTFGFVISLFIECCQWFFRLGVFEFDDLLHNTVGSGIGAFIVNKTPIGKWFRQQVVDQKKSLKVMICLVPIFVFISFGYQGIKYQEMKLLAALNDREGMENLLVLTPNPKHIGQSDVDIIYNSDGSILIKGKAANRAWIQVARFSLSPGQYYMEGMSGCLEKTIGLELAKFDIDENTYVMVGHEVGTVDRLNFELTETSKMEVLISLYPGWEGSVTSRPAIFREDK